ncbi:hypothetical protein AA0X95_17075 [Bacillus sp. 1P10SD]|uniref:hypothetical protein n=1 Tax=Bacillus sp. 1P10SD TaxID=3132265 RepID=UPI0039A672C7
MLSSEEIELKDALEAIDYYYKQGWTDRLPIIPPTEDRILEMLKIVNLKPKTIIVSIPERGRIFTAELVAINTVMAGCLPCYFPVITSAVEAISAPEFGLYGPTASTHGAAIMMIVKRANHQ